MGNWQNMMLQSPETHKNMKTLGKPDTSSVMMIRQNANISSLR